MIPRFETSNELWNTAGTLDTQYAQVKASLYGWPGNPGQSFNWLGKVASICGHSLLMFLAVRTFGTTYHRIVGVQTQVFPTSNSNDRLVSTDFLTIDPNPVQTNTFGELLKICGGGSECEFPAKLGSTFASRTITARLSASCVKI